MNESIRRIYELQVKLAQESLNALKALQQHASNAEGALGRLGDIAKSFGKGLLGGLSVGFVFSQLKDAIFGAIDAIDQLDKSATRLKMPIEEFTALKYAAFQADTEIGELEAGMKFLQKAFADFQDPAKETTKILKALGVDPTGKTMTQNLLDLAAGFEKVTDANLKTRAELALMSRGGTAMSNFLQKGAEGIKELTEESKRLNNVTEESALLQGNYERQLKMMQTATDAVTRSFAEGLLPGLTAILKAFNESPRALEMFRIAGTFVAAVLKDMAIRANNVALGVEFFGKAMVRLREASAALVSGEFAQAGRSIAAIGDEYASAKEKQAAFVKTMEDTAPAAAAVAVATNVSTAANARLAAALKDVNKEQQKQIDAFNRRRQQLEEALVKLKDEDAANSEVAKLLREIEIGTLKVNAVQKQRLITLAEEIDLLRGAEKAAKGWVTQIDQTIASQREAGEAGRDFLLHMERLTSGTVSAEIKRLRLEIDALNEALLDTDDPEWLGGLTENIRKAQDRIRELANAAKGEVIGLDKLMLEVADRADGYGKDLSGLFVDFATNADGAETSFTDFAVSFLRQLAQMTLQTLIFEDVIKSVREQLRLWAAQRAATSTASSIGSAIDMGVRSAKGNAFLGGNVLPFARGGVVTRPTLFAMAGGAGLMGEAGPEAVLPLHRGADGSLGVRGGSTVNVSVINNSSARARTEEQTQPDGTVNVSIMIEDVVDKALTRGRFDNSMGQVYGSTRRGRM